MSTLNGQATPEQIAQWKKDNPLGIYSLSVGEHIGYFKRPGFAELNYAFSKANGDSTLDMYQAFAEKTWLGGSEELLTNPTLFSGVSRKLKKVMDGEEAELVNL